MAKAFTRGFAAANLCALLCLSITGCSLIPARTSTAPACQTPAQWHGDLYSVDMLSPRDGWAAGQALFHFDGTRWCRAPHTPNATLYSISMVNAHDGWAAGGTALLHYDGTNWQPVPVPGGGWLGKVEMLAANDGWAIGFLTSKPGTPPRPTLVLHYDGSVWRQVPVPDGPPTLNDIAMTSATDGWAVADDDQSHALMLHYDGTR